jgi:hypothetical protein
MQKKPYEAPDLIAYGTVEALTGGGSHFSSWGFGDGSRTSSKHHWDKDDEKDYWHPHWSPPRRWNWWGH